MLDAFLFLQIKQLLLEKVDTFHAVTKKSMKSLDCFGTKGGWIVAHLFIRLSDIISA